MRLTLPADDIFIGAADLFCPDVLRSKAVQVTNSGASSTGPLAVTVDGKFVLISDACSGTALAGGASCELVVQYQAPGVQPDSAVGHLSAQADPGGTAQAQLDAFASYAFAPKSPLIRTARLDVPFMAGCNRIASASLSGRGAP